MKEKLVSANCQEKVKAGGMCKSIYGLLHTERDFWNTSRILQDVAT